MKLIRPEQMRRMDASAIKDYSIPGLLLMENAASAVAAQAESMLGGCSGVSIVAVAGIGNNGGDAFAAARLLHCKGANIRVYLLGCRDNIKGDALANLEMLERIGIRVNELGKENAYVEGLTDLRSCIENAQLIIDGIFGTGLTRDITGLAENVIQLINNSGKPVLSIDIPSGIDGTDGSIKGICIKADTTVTFCMAKTGLALNPGYEYAGKLIVADIGIPPCIRNSITVDAEVIDHKTAAAFIPKRVNNSNKGDYGRVLIITGSTGMTGSGCLAAKAALRSGAGLTYVGVPESLSAIYGAALTEPIILPLIDSGSGTLSRECADNIVEYTKKMDAVAIGPGLTSGEEIKSVVERVLCESRAPMVIDADALNCISGNTEILKGLKTKAVITPHPGEMSRLTGLSIKDIQADRPGTAKKFAIEFGIIVVLKGNRTVVSLPDGRVFINPTGNAGMASAGAGDVLTGIIAGLAAQGAALESAAIAGVFLHGLAGDLAAGELGMHSMIAGDVIRHLPDAFNSICDESYFKLRSTTYCGCD